MWEVFVVSVLGVGGTCPCWQRAPAGSWFGPQPKSVKCCPRLEVAVCGVVMYGQTSCKEKTE